MKTTNCTQSTKLVTGILALFLLVLAACGGGDSNKVSANGAKPPSMDIHTAVIKGDTVALKQHIAAGTNINEKDPFGGSSPLISAAVFGQTETAKILINSGADLNFQNNDGSTALHTAAFFCRPEIVQMLLQKGADKSLKNTYGATPYETVAGPFADARNVYDMIGKMLEPMGLKLDYAHLEKTRPVIADMLR
jgi:uncharacterized protein